MRDENRMAQRLPVLAFAAAAMLATIAGCGGCGANRTPCLEDQQCPAGESCNLGFCSSPCGDGCAAGEVCDDGTCFPRHCPSTACAENGFCFEGSCSYAGCRDVACPADSVCTPGGACVPTTCSGGLRCGESGQVCDPGGERCTDPSCLGLSCGEGQRCFFGACRDATCNGRSCGDGFCVDGRHCKDCPDRACGPDQACSGGVCQNIGCLLNPPVNCPCPADAVGAEACRAGEVCIPLEPDGESASPPVPGAAPTAGCATQHCETFRCPDGTVCTGSSCVPVRCVTDEITCNDGQGCAGDGNCYPRSCGELECAAGFFCVDGGCRPGSCIGVSCPDGSGCFAGGCYSQTCNGRQCAAGELCIAGACTPSYPPGGGPVICDGQSCPDGYVCTANGCTAPECAGGNCGARCGTDYCGPGEWCNGSICMSPCEICPEGYSCSAGGQPPCVFNGCADLQCPERTHCVPKAGGGAECQATVCGEEICSDNEVCENGRCVDFLCVGKDCGPTGRCMFGHCYDRCCPGLQCGEDTICINGQVERQHCETHTCDDGFVCQAEVCVPINRLPDPGCFATKRPESLRCDGIDSNCNSLVDDFYVTPVIRTVGGPWAMGPATRGGYQCAICDKVTSGGVNGTLYGPRVSCGTDFRDNGKSVYAGLGGKNQGERMYNIVDWYDDEYLSTFDDFADMTSCVRFDLPCEMNARKVHVKFSGVTQVPCNLSDQCSGQCRAPKMHVFRWDPDWREWEAIGRAFAGIDVSRLRSFWLDPWTKKPQRVRRLLICRGDYNTNRGNLGIDGVSVEGCCAN